jgi:uncharacterized protein (TIGR02145 family)
MKLKTTFWIYQLAIIGIFLLLSTSCKKSNDNNNNNTLATVTDMNGNVYHTVTIGTQIWMVENLKTTKFNDGTAIPLVTNHWGNLSTPGYCWYYDTNYFKNPYGALYNWFAVNTGKLAPKGWHIPTDAEWDILITYLGGEDIAGGKMKETDTTHWIGNVGADNSSGFTALPGGLCSVNNYFNDLGYHGFWWSMTEKDESGSWSRELNSPNTSVIHQYFYKPVGCSVRCLKN